MKPARAFSAGRHHSACRDTTTPLMEAMDIKVSKLVVVCMIVNTDAGEGAF